MRTNLILHLHCSDCGKRLELCYPKEVSEKPVKPEYGETDKEPTGAECFYPPEISVAPCRHCIEKYTRPAKQLTDAIKTLQTVEV